MTSVSRSRIFHGVGHQIVDGVLHQFAIAFKIAVQLSRRHADILALAERPHARQARFHQFPGREWLALQLHLAVGEPLDIQERLDHPRQAFGFLVDHLRHLLALFLAQVVAAHQLAGSLNGGERRAHFVRDEMDGLLVALAFGFRSAQRAADDEVLVAGGGRDGQPR